MAEFAMHTEDYPREPKTAPSPPASALPHANSSEYQAVLRASHGGPSSSSTEGNADLGAPSPSSFHFLRNYTLHTHGGGLFKDPSAVSEDSNGKSRADFSGFVHPHAVSVCPGSPHSKVFFRGPMDAYTGIFEEPSGEEAVCLHEEQDSTKSCGHNEVYTCTCVKSNDSNSPSRVVCAGSSYAGRAIVDPRGQSSKASARSYEKFTSTHEECGDLAEPCGSSEAFPLSHAVYEDLCADNAGIIYNQKSRVDAASTHGCGGDPAEELVDPYFRDLDVHATDNLQTCSSECSSASSMVTDAALENPSRLDNTYLSIDCMDSQWTDAKHGSYLDYMETNFVKNLFGSEYCAVDVCGRRPLHQWSEETSPFPSTLFEFKLWQSGDWHRRSMLMPPCIPLTLLKSPWVDHFLHHNISYAKLHTNIEKASTFFSTDEGEEVNSPSPKLPRHGLSHPNTFRSKMGQEEKATCDSISDEAVGSLRQDGSQEFARATNNARFSNLKKRGFETDHEQDSIRCKQGRHVSDTFEVIGSTK